MTVAERMSYQEFVYWTRFHSRRAQAQQLELRKAGR